MPVHTTEMSGVSYRATDVGAALEPCHPTRQSDRRASGRTTGSPSEIPGIVGRAVHVVVALEVREVERNVGLAQDMGAGALETLDDNSIGPGDVLCGAGAAPRGREDSTSQNQ